MHIVYLSSTQPKRYGKDRLPFLYRCPSHLLSYAHVGEEFAHLGRQDPPTCIIPLLSVSRIVHTFSHVFIQKVIYAGCICEIAFVFGHFVKMFTYDSFVHILLWYNESNIIDEYIIHNITSKYIILIFTSWLFSWIVFTFISLLFLSTVL